jgi:hypothetical protein
MATTLTETKRSTIAQKLADMREVQNLLIANEQQFLNQCQDPEICDRLRNMLEDDRKNLNIINEAINNFGMQADVTENLKDMLNRTRQMIDNTTMNMCERMMHHEMLKHSQVMCGLIMHKAAQIVGGDVYKALSSINTVNFENRAHQEQLKGILEVIGTRELTGQEPDQGVWGRVQDAIAALTGAFGSASSQTSK